MGSEATRRHMSEPESQASYDSELTFNENEQYRNNRAGPRSNRTQIDHDVFEGLPVRQWRRASTTVNVLPQKENQGAANVRSSGWPELPMPRDSHMYSPLSQALLRAARMGQIVRPPPPPAEDEKDIGGEEDDAEREMDSAFVARKWTLVPRNLEFPEPEFLAKRRKGLQSAYGGTEGLPGLSAPMRKTKVKKMDSEGNVSVLEVYAPEGRSIQGEIIEEIAPTETPAPGTIVDGVGVVNVDGVVVADSTIVPTPSRRRPPPPKRKKGPGRGRRKKAALSFGIDVPVASSNRAHGNENPSAANHEVAVADSLSAENANGSNTLGDESNVHEGDEASDSSSEVDDGEDGDREEGELSPSPNPDAPSLLSHSPSMKPPQQAVKSSSDGMSLRHAKQEMPTNIHRDPSSSPELPLASTKGDSAFAVSLKSAQESVIALANNVGNIQKPRQDSIESTPRAPLSSSNTAILNQHDHLDCQIEPTALKQEKPRNQPEENMDSTDDLFEISKRQSQSDTGIVRDQSSNQGAKFSDGDDNLLGSLDKGSPKEG